MKVLLTEPTSVSYALDVLKRTRPVDCVVFTPVPPDLLPTYFVLVVVRGGFSVNGVIRALGPGNVLKLLGTQSQFRWLKPNDAYCIAVSLVETEVVAKLSAAVVDVVE